MIIADTSGLLAFFNALEPAHKAVVEAVSSETDPLVVSPFVLAKRFATRRILTLDRRRFDVQRPLDGGRFTILGG